MSTLTYVMSNPLTRLCLIVWVAATSACAPSREAPAAPAPSAGPPGVSGKAPPGAIVSLEPVPSRAFPMPDGPAVMDQYAKQFVPDLVIARVGQPVEFLNSDDFGHNVIVNRRSTGASVFNVSMDTRQKHTFAFTQPGEYAVMCDIHEGMLATVFVTSSPYTARADAAGTFTIPDVPPGSYRASMVVSGGGSKEQAIAVSSERTEIKFTP
jgi:plastocyanin